jgi:hypothetical protein
MGVVGEILAGAYDPMVEFAADPKRIVDLGAHIGLTSRLLERRFPDAEIVAVEANPMNLPVLRANLPRATIIDRPVAAAKRRVALVGDRLDGYRIVDDHDGPLETITMGEIPGDISLLKVDIEGTEEELFADCSEWIGRVATIVCECHYPYRAADLVDAISGAGRRAVVEHLLVEDTWSYDLVTLRLE